VPRATSDIDDHYEEDFDEIDEDLPDGDIDGSGNGLTMGKQIADSHGITVS